MTDDWLNEIDNKEIVGAVVSDLNAAFDIIDNNLLLRKSMCYGFSTSAILWIQIYISNRTQKVFFNGSFSNVKNVKCGVPQGSSLGPLLFSIFTNDLPLALNQACVSMYADDSSIYASASSAKVLSSVLEWVASNKLVLSNFKTKSFVFGTNHSLSF